MVSELLMSVKILLRAPPLLPDDLMCLGLTHLLNKRLVSAEW